jgi:hypothetical protein
MDAVKNCTTGELFLNVKSKTPRFKAGAELAHKVNMVDVNFNQEFEGEALVTDLKLHLQVHDCAVNVRPIVK